MQSTTRTHSWRARVALACCGALLAAGVVACSDDDDAASTTTAAAAATTVAASTTTEESTTTSASDTTEPEGTTPSTGSGPEVPADVAKALADVLDKELYDHSTWGVYVEDEATGEVLVDHNGQLLFVTGSIMKTLSTAGVLEAWGPDQKFATPVYRTGEVADGVLNGDLVLVASGGDFSFGLREQADGTLRYATLPVVDHNEANAGLPGRSTSRGDPWAALDSLAGQVKAAGINQVNDVAIDDRVFEAYRGWSDGVIAPIWFNENLVDVSVAPGAAAGDAPTVTWRPETAAYTVRSNVTTVATGQVTAPLAVSLAEPGVLQVDGQIEAGGVPQGRYYLVDDPSAWARTGFIEALGRAGVTVTAAATGPNPEAAVPTAPYDPATKVAEHTSATLAQLVKVVQKVSFNRGADLLVCLTAVKGGSTSCPQGLPDTYKTVTALGIPANTTYQFDGAGSDERSRTSPGAMSAFLRGVSKAPWAKAFEDSLPILGVDGTLGNNQAGTPAAGHVFAKTGTRAAFTEARRPGS